MQCSFSCCTLLELRSRDHSSERSGRVSGQGASYTNVKNTVLALADLDFFEAGARGASRLGRSRNYNVLEFNVTPQHATPAQDPLEQATKNLLRNLPLLPFNFIKPRRGGRPGPIKRTTRSTRPRPGPIKRTTRSTHPRPGPIKRGNFRSPNPAKIRPSRPVPSPVP